MISKNRTLKQVITELSTYLNQQVIGQSSLVSHLLIALLADGHLLVEGAPGLAKTRAVNVLAKAIEGDFHRIQFTPDLLPADITGTEIFHPQTGDFTFQPGPLFHHLILADEINRAPAKVQSALLEAMGERQITIGKITYPLPKLFLVMATQNPIEHEGTYSLPEAQLDRFLMYVKIKHPNSNAERLILHLARHEALHPFSEQTFYSPLITQEEIFAARREILNIHLSEALENYIIHIIMATRNPGPYNLNLLPLIHFGVSPRGTISLERCARAHAWLNGRDYVSPQDIHTVVHDVLRHRILLTYEARAEGITTDKIIDDLLTVIPVP
ncbi:MAG: hypothetical protein LEGION0398_MBIBDBAK_00653 [Legionellaceae bacterium]